MKARLTAYRKEFVTDDTYDIKEYNLDLMADPSVSINFNWLDLKEPDQRKTDFSQTIKLPFTDSNNTFFQNWFDVNLQTLVFNATDKYSSILYVDSIPQLTGYIQLKAIYVNSRHYEVVIFGNTANLFTDIKGKRLQDCFTTQSTASSGVLLDDVSLDHVLTMSNVVNSWKGTLTTVGGSTTNDILYPIIDYGNYPKPLGDGMFYSLDPNAYQSLLDNGQLPDDISLATIILNGGIIVPSKLKPAIRIRALLLKIFQKAGYTCQSTFLGINQDGTFDTNNEWFGKMYMTMANQFQRVQGSPLFAFSVTAGSQTFTSDNDYNDTFITWDTEIYDQTGWFWLPESALVIPNYSGVPGIQGTGLGIDPTTVQFQIQSSITVPATMDNGSDLDEFTITYNFLSYYNGNYYEKGSESITYNTNGAGGTIDIQYTPAVSVIPGEMLWYQIQFECLSTTTFTMNNASWELINNGYSGWGNASYGSTISVRRNLPDITQADFLKDLINRFNLIITTQDEDPKNLIIEPYNDYVATGTTKYWTDKLDESKEIRVTPTNDIQKNSLLFTDIESDDLINGNYIKQFNKVYGSLTKYNLNEFGKASWQTPSIFAPFVVQGIPQTSIFVSGILSETNLAIHYACTQNESGDWVQKDEKPKLFWYSGSPVIFSGNDMFGNALDWHVATGAYGIENYEQVDVSDILGYNGFPLCLPYDIANGLGNANPLDSGGITTSTKMLFWTHYNPGFYTNYVGGGFQGQANMWGGNVFGTTVSKHGLFDDYWSQYINEIYSDDARIMDCHIYLTPGDIANFKFANKIYIKNSVWRVLSISNYSLVDKKSTQVRLLKVVEKNANECESVPSSYNDDGTITFVDPQNPSGGSVDVTIECCTGINPNLQFIQTNDTTGVGTCYWNLGTNLAPNNTLNQNLVNVPPINTMENKSITLSDNSFRLQNITFFMECITTNDVESKFRYMGIDHKIFRMPINSISQIQVDVTGDIVGGTDGNIGEVGYVQYYTVMKNLNHTITHLGPAGGQGTRSMLDTNFPTPGVKITSNESNALVMSVGVTGNKKIKWLAKVNIVVRQIRGNRIPKLKYYVQYQNEDPIMFQDGAYYMRWN